MKKLQEKDDKGCDQITKTAGDSTLNSSSKTVFDICLVKFGQRPNSQNRKTKLWHWVSIYAFIFQNPCLS